MSEAPRVDHYESLHLSPSADRETVERVYRLLAKRYHPDNPDSADPDRFARVREAYEVLSDPDRRAAYDARYDPDRTRRWKIFRPGSASHGRSEDERTVHAILSILYLARRRDPTDAGMAPSRLESMLGVPREHLRFPLWYLKKRGYIETLDNGLSAITVDGVDRLADEELALPADRLLADASAAPAEADPPSHHLYLLDDGPEVSPETDDPGRP